MQIIINPEFKNLIPPLSVEERQLLEDNILRDGCRDALLLWNDTLIDGHNRHEICSRLEIPFDTKQVTGLETVDDAINWIIDNQLGRRNITGQQRDYLLGLRYRQEKKTEAFKGNQHTNSGGGQNDHQQKTAEKIATQHNVTEKTVRRAEKFADGVDKIAAAMPEMKAEILQGKSELTKQDVASLARVSEEKIQEEVEKRIAEKKNRYAQVAAKMKESGHVEQSQQNEIAAITLNIKTGDVITVKGKQTHKIFVGSCEDELILQELKKCSCVITDPPYGVAYKSPSGNGLTARGNYKIIENDDKDYSPEILFKISDKIVTWGANHYANKLPNSAGWLVWDKREGEQINNNSDCELAWTNMINSARMFHHRWNGMIKASEQGQKRIHPTQKPIALFIWALDICAAGETVAEPYLGSGSNLIACEETGRTCIASEIDVEYVAASINRFLEKGMEVFINEQRI